MQGSSFKAIDSSDRRLFLGALTVAGMSVGLATPSKADDKPVVTKSRIVVLGAGAAGLSLVSRLAKRLDGAVITVLDPRKDHLYQPGYTLVAAGLKSSDYVVSKTQSYLPTGVQWIPEAFAELDPDRQIVVSESGRRIEYDYLVVATGIELNYEAIAGMDVSRIGQNGLGSVYHSAASAEATWQAMSAFADKGGVGVFGRPAGEMKCAGAPLKYTFITDDYLRRRGKRSKAELHFMAHNNALFGVPIVSEKVRMLFEDRQVKVKESHLLREIDIDRKIAFFEGPAGRVEQPYDFINVVPPMRAPKPLRGSSLAWQTGPWAADGYVEVSPATLRHPRYKNVFAVGDIAGVPKGKTAASVKWQVPVVVDHLVADIAGTTSDSSYNGYTSCPMITRLGRAMLIEFDYRNNLVPSFPGAIAPLEELWVSWVMKTMALKPTYISMLKGLA